MICNCLRLLLMSFFTLGQLFIVIPPNSNALFDWTRTCHVQWIQNSLGKQSGRTKLTNSLGKQQLELSTRTWSGCELWNRGKFVSSRVKNYFFLRQGRDTLSSPNRRLKNWTNDTEWKLEIHKQSNIKRWQKSSVRNKTYNKALKN